jgi:hypothetical protein
MTEMSNEEIVRFVMQGTFTGKLATVRKTEVLMLFQSGLYWIMRIAKEEV